MHDPRPKRRACPCRPDRPGNGHAYPSLAARPRAGWSARDGLADAGGARRAFDKRKILYNMKASEIRLINKLEEGLRNGNSTSYEQNRCTYAQDSGFRWQ